LFGFGLWKKGKYGKVKKQKIDGRTKEKIRV